MLRPRRFSSICMLLFLGSTAGIASAQAPANPTFEVASIKPNKSGTNQRQVNWEPNGRFTAINVTSLDLLMQSLDSIGFSVHFHQIDCPSPKPGTGVRLLCRPIN